MSTVLDFIRGLVSKEAARLISYATAAAVAGALKAAEFAGVTLSAEAIAGVAAIATVIATELIRRFVYSTDTVTKIAAEAAASGDPAVGPPPSGEVDAPLAAPYAGEEDE
jgi:hypothetical protein